MAREVLAVLDQAFADAEEDFRKVFLVLASARSEVRRGIEDDRVPLEEVEGWLQECIPYEMFSTYLSDTPVSDAFATLSRIVTTKEGESST